MFLIFFAVGVEFPFDCKCHRANERNIFKNIAESQLVIINIENLGFLRINQDINEWNFMCMFCHIFPIELFVEEFSII